MIPFLRPGDPFPPVSKALRSPNGLLCAGADLSPARLLEAYSKGIFPWYSEGEPILWWSPHPRMVLFPGELKVDFEPGAGVTQSIRPSRSTRDQSSPMCREPPLHSWRAATVNDAF